MRAPPAACASASLTRALRVAAAVGRGDIVELRRRLDAAPLLEAACMLRLLPEARGAALLQANAAHTARELVPCKALCARLMLRDAADVARCAAAHGAVCEELPAGILAATAVTAVAVTAVRFKSAELKRVAAPLAPPLAAPHAAAIRAWREGAAREGADRKGAIGEGAAGVAAGATWRLLTGAEAKVGVHHAVDVA